MDVWQIDLEHAGRLDAFLEVLDKQEKDRANKFRFENHARHFIVAHAATRFVLSSYCGIRAADLFFERNAYGKPFLVKRGAPLFSLSHSGAIAMCAVAQTGEIGVDIEKYREIDGQELSRRFFSSIECTLLDSLADEQKTAGFFACWTRKEAYIKAKGLGLSLPLNEFSVDPAPHRPAALIASDYAPQDVERFRLWDVPAPKGYKAALAYCGAEEGPPVLRSWVMGV